MTTAITGTAPQQFPCRIALTRLAADAVGVRRPVFLPRLQGHWAAVPCTRQLLRPPHVRCLPLQLRDLLLRYRHLACGLQMVSDFSSLTPWLPLSAVLHTVSTTNMWHTYQDCHKLAICHGMFLLASSRHTSAASLPWALNASAAS